MKKAIILASGGIDSSTLLAVLSNKQEYEIYALSFDYMQRHHIELNMIKRFISDYEVKEHKIIKIDLSAFKTSSLMNCEIDVPKYSEATELGNSVPNTYVPARNTIFLSYALGFAEVINASDIFIGVHATDYANYPDCRLEYLDSFETMANFALTHKQNPIKIHAPFINMTKGNIIAKGLECGVNFANTISCYDPLDDGKSCGFCHACLIRLAGFKANDYTDPISYK